MTRCPLPLLFLFATACPSTVPDPTPPASTGGMAGEAVGTGGTGAPMPGTGGAGGGDGIQALSPSTFVFSRVLPRGEENVVTKKYSVYARHLVAYDLATRTERLISTLDDDGKSRGPSIIGHAVSPDRKWVAFGSLDFRQSAEDIKFGFKAGALWAVSVDGKAFRRLTPPLNEALDRGGRCGPGLPPCIVGERCDASGSCKRESLDVSYRYPTWAPDGKTLYFTQQLWWVCPGFDQRPCVYAVVRGARDGAMLQWNAPFNSCIADVPLAHHPTTGGLLVRRGSCVKFQDGLYEWNTSPPGEKRLIAAYSGATEGHLSPKDSAAWLPDGSGLLFVAAGKTRKTAIGPTKLRYNRQGIYRWTESDGVKLVYEPAEDGLDPESVAISADGQVVVEIIRPTATGDNSQLHLFDLQTGTLGAQLTSGDDNEAPRF